MIKATFDGRNASGYVHYWGVRFPCGEPVTVESDAAIAGVQRHPEFSWQPIEAEPLPVIAENHNSAMREIMADHRDTTAAALQEFIAPPKRRRRRRK
jgi:hypothetical protein